MKQNVMKFEVFILGRQRIDQKERRDGGEGEEREDNNLKRRIRNIDTCLCLLFSFLKALSSRLDSAVKCYSIELGSISLQLVVW